LALIQRLDAWNREQAAISHFGCALFGDARFGRDAVRFLSKRATREQHGQDWDDEMFHVKCTKCEW
jgi:hypothetical protein